MNDLCRVTADGYLEFSPEFLQRCPDIERVFRASMRMLDLLEVN